MDEKTLDYILQELPFAYAYHRMIFDDKGNPIDYEFVEVNRAFEHMTALKKDDLIGQRVTQVIPGIREDPADWISIYGRVVQKKQSTNFKQYSKPLDKWYHVYALSPSDGFFVTLFMDVTEDVKRLNEQAALFNALNDVILELDEHLSIVKVLMASDTPIPLPPERMPSSAEQLIGMKPFDFLSEEDLAIFNQAIENARQSQNKVIMYQHMVLAGEDVWYQLMIKHMIINGLSRFVISIINFTEQKLLEAKLREKEAIFQTIFEQAPIGISITNKDENLYPKIDDGATINKAYMSILGRTKDELAKLRWTDITHPNDLQEDRRQSKQFLTGKTNGYTMEKRYIRPDGSVVWTNLIISALKDKENKTISHLCLLEDITKRKTLEKSLYESERSKSVLLSHLPGLAYRCLNDSEWTMKFVSDGCFALTGYKAESLIDNKELSYNDLVAPEYREQLFKDWENVIARKTSYRGEYQITTASGQKKWVLESGQPVFSEAGELVALEGIVVDIDEQKRREQRILYMSEHDELTKLYNLRYFNAECKRHNFLHTYPVAIVQCDVDGLRLINDSFGFQEGDSQLKRVADILTANSADCYILARTGDDDFSLLMPGADANEAEHFITKVIQCINEDNDRKDRPYITSLSFGYSTRKTPTEEIDVTLKITHDNLNNSKILNNQSSHSAILSSIMTAIHTRSEETEEHAQRLFKLSEAVGRQLGLSQQAMAELELFSKLHDVGKIGISDIILNKAGLLTEDERELMKKHSEISYRIAISLADIRHVANDILAHHERWDGKGYPRGLSGEDIPILARILAVSDAYDAMTQDRVYRKAMPKEEAIEEIINHSGSQFDPKIASLFVEIYR